MHNPIGGPHERGRCYLTHAFRLFGLEEQMKGIEKNLQEVAPELWNQCDSLTWLDRLTKS